MRQDVRYTPLPTSEEHIIYKFTPPVIRGCAIYFFPPKEVVVEVPEVESWPASLSRLVRHGVSIALILPKILASLGTRVYANRELLYNPYYVFSEGFFNRWPDGLKLAILCWTGSSDVYMNLVTRGVATKRMMDKVFGVAIEVDQPPFFTTPWRKFLKYGVYSSGIISSASSSLSAFLGAVTIMSYFTDDFSTLMTIGLLVSGSNFATCLSYRVKKSINNLGKLLNNEFEYNALNVSLCLVGAAATTGMYYFGTSEALRKLLEMFDIYKGDPDSRIDVTDFWENLINGITDALLFPSMVAYFFSQCAEILSVPKPESGEYFKVNLEHFEAKYQEVTQRQPYFKKLKPWHKDFYYPRFVRLFTGSLISFFILGEMSGEILQKFNGVISFLIHLFYEDRENVFSQQDKIIIGTGATCLALISAVIYWRFNIVDWKEKTSAYRVDTALGTLESAGLFNINSQGSWSQLRVLFAEDQVELAEAHPLLEDSDRSNESDEKVPSPY